MLNTAERAAYPDRGTYDVHLDLGSLKLGPVGLAGIAHSVALGGRIDDRWLECYRTVQSESPDFSQFRLDDSTATVEFQPAADDGPSEIIGALEILDSLVNRVNERCE